MHGQEADGIGFKGREELRQAKIKRVYFPGFGLKLVDLAVPQKELIRHAVLREWHIRRRTHSYWLSRALGPTMTSAMLCHVGSAHTPRTCSPPPNCTKPLIRVSRSTRFAGSRSTTGEFTSKSGPRKVMLPSSKSMPVPWYRIV